MSVQKVTWEYVNGVPAFNNLMNMIEAAIQGARLSIYGKSAGWEFKGYWLENKTSPSLTDVTLGCGISSTSVANYHLKIMQREGIIYTRTKGRRRSIVPIGMTIYFP